MQCRREKIITESGCLIPPQRFIPDGILLAETYFHKIYTYIIDLRSQFARRTCCILSVSKILPLVE